MNGSGKGLMGRGVQMDLPEPPSPLNLALHCWQRESPTSPAGSR